MLPTGGRICGRLTQDLRLGCLQGGLTNLTPGTGMRTWGFPVLAENSCRSSLCGVWRVLSDELVYWDEYELTRDGPESRRVLVAMHIFTRVFTLGRKVYLVLKVSLFLKKDAWCYQTMNHEPWTMNHGPWTMNHELWAMNHEPRTMNQPWTMHHEPCTMSHEPWTMNHETWFRAWSLGISRQEHKHVRGGGVPTP